MTPNVYEYNPECECEVCRNGGVLPTGTPGNGHSFGYAVAHMPPSTRPPWTRDIRQGAK
jgi:hypothetical protein